MTDAAAPFVSVVIPTRNRAGSLRRTLAALARQTYPADRFEVVVAANACTDDTAGMVRCWTAPPAVTLVEHPRASSSAARNAGAAVARGALLLFVDDDVEPVSVFVETHVRAHRSGDGTLVAFGALLAPDLTGRQSLLVEKLHDIDRSFSVARAQAGDALDFWSAASGNMSMPRAFFQTLGGFDVTAPSYGGEDYELAYRAQVAGARFAFVAEAGGVHHQNENTTLATFLAKTRAKSRNDVVRARRHPAIAHRARLEEFHRPRTPFAFVARRCAFDHPRVGDAAAEAGRRLCEVLDTVRWRKPWAWVLHRLDRYWFIRGVADELATRAAFGAFVAHVARHQRESA
jgi:glycosyltransferase involved in cell wall biosynthesis